MKLKDYMKKNGIKLEDAAKDLSTHMEYVRAIASERVRPGPQIVLRIEAWSNGEVTRAELRPDLWQDAA